VGAVSLERFAFSGGVRNCVGRCLCRWECHLGIFFGFFSYCLFVMCLVWFLLWVGESTIYVDSCRVLRSFCEVRLMRLG